MLNYDQSIVDQAILMLSNEIKEPTLKINSPDTVKSFLQLKLSGLLNEQFSIMFLDNQHNLIEFETLFFGTINASSVHPRVVVQRALYHNAAAVILAHNHPSGVSEPSLSDIDITKTLKKILKVLDVRLLDHIIVAGKTTTSLLERGDI
jgi:DNA repair protein RadC